MSAAPWKLSTKLGVVGGTLLLLVLVSIALTLSVTWQLEGGAAAVNEAGRMRMQTWRLAQALSGGDSTRVEQHLQAFDRSLALLSTGDPSRPLFVPGDERSQDALEKVRTQWQALRPQWSAAAALPPATVAAQADRFVASIDAFVDAIEQQLARWTEVLHGFELALMGLAIGSAVALLYAAYLFVFNPLARLQHGLARLEGGEFGTRVDASARDEFGALAAGFNRMAETLQGLYGSLEQKVQDKTQRLEAEHARLAALYEASAGVARADSLDELAHGFVRQFRRVARADAAALRWCDESNRRYLLLASDSLPQHIIDGEQCVRTGDCLCGQPQAAAGMRVIPINSGQQADALGHCARAGFETLLSVPVRLHDRLLGEVDLFYRGPLVPGVEDRALLDTLASHLAGGMEALRVGALEREAAVAEERSLLARELHDSIAQSLAFLKIQVQLLREAVRRGRPEQVERVIAELDAGVRESTADVRELLVHFRTRTSGEDIAPALQSTLRKFEHQTGLATHLSVKGDGLPLDPDVQVQVLHVVQEALSNVRKHAQARQVWVEVQQWPCWRVEVRDDGKGFAGMPRDDEPHVGLGIMRERAASIGATVAVDSSPGAGTRIVLTLPPPALRVAA